jgi:hypothetical protein
MIAACPHSNLPVILRDKPGGNNDDRKYFGLAEKR